MPSQARPTAGTFVWNELMTTDPEGVLGFYQALFGWQTRDVDMGPAGVYRVIRADGRDIGGIMAMTGPEWQGVLPQWMAYVAVDSVDEAARKVESLGGKVCVPPTDIPNVGRFAVINDPAGATVSLFEGNTQGHPG